MMLLHSREKRGRKQQVSLLNPRLISHLALTEVPNHPDNCNKPIYQIKNREKNTERERDKIS